VVVVDNLVGNVVGFAVATERALSCTAELFDDLAVNEAVVMQGRLRVLIVKHMGFRIIIAKWFRDQIRQLTIFRTYKKLKQSKHHILEFLQVYLAIFVLIDLLNDLRPYLVLHMRSS
jgi:hypothetical protein